MPVKASGANANLRLRGTAGDSETDINEEINGESTDANANVSLATLSTGVGFDTTDGGHKMSEFFGYSSGPACTTETWDILNETTIPTKALYTLNGNSKDTGESGYIGQGGIFNGSSSKVVISSFAQPTGDVSVSMFIKFNSISSAQKEFFDWVGNSSVPTIRINTYNSTDLRFSAGGGIYISSDSLSVTTGVWYHIALSIDRSTNTGTCYFNGKSLGGTISTTGSSVDTPGLFIGANLDENRFSNCVIDQVRIFNKAISASEVTTLARETYASSTKSTTDIFGDNSGLALYELEGNADDTSTNYTGTDNDVKYGSDGADNNITYSTGKFGNAAVFNGSNSYITGSPNIGFGQSISMWFDVDSNISGYQGKLWSQSNSGGLVWAGAGLYWDGSNFYFSMQLRNGAYRYQTAGIVTVNSGWNHIVFTFDSNAGYSAWLNNSELTMTTNLVSGTLSSFPAPTGTTTIGRQWGNNDDWYFKGKIDQVRIFDKKLSSDQVKALYNEPTATPYDAYINNSIKTKAYFPLNAHGSSIKSSSTAIDAGQSAVFDGSSSSIVLGSAVIPANNFSISMWVNSNDVFSQNNLITQYVFAGGSNGRFVFVIDGGYFQAYVESNGSGTNFNYILSNNTWYHVTLIKSGSWECFVNGSSVGTWSDTVNITTSYNTQIGSRISSSNSMDGSIDQVRIYSSVLSSSDVTNLYNETNVPTANLVAHYKLDGNGNDATGNYNASSISNITYSDPALIGDAPSYNAVSLTGVTFDQGKFNRAAIFNGSTSEIVTDLKNSDLSTLGVGDFSVSFWVYQNATASHAPLINGYKASNNGWYIELVNGKIYTFIGQDGSVAYRRGYFDVTLNLREWYHIVYDNKNNRVWLNGAEITSTFVDDSYLTVTTIGDAEINIGRQDVVNNYWFNGAIDQVRFVEGSITKEDVTKLYDEFQCDCNTNTVDFPTTNAVFYNLNGNANDSTTNNYNGTVSGSVNWIKGLFGTAAIFDGSSGYIDTNYTVPADSSMSFSVWFNTSSTSRQAIFADYNSAGSGASARAVLFIGSGASNDKFEVVIGNGSSFWNDFTTDASSYQDGNWHNIVVVYNGTSVKLYADGNTTPIADLTSSVSYGTIGSQSLVLGRCGDYNGCYYNGKLDQVRIFNDALTDLEIAKLFNTTPCISSSVAADILGDNSVVAFYSMDDVYTDSTGSYTGSSNGTLSFVDGKTNKALKVSTDTQGYIQTNLNWLSGDSVSLSFWFKADSTSDFNHTIFYADPNPGQSNENSAFIGNYTGAYNNEIINIGSWTSSGLCLYSAIGTSSTQLYDNQWHFIVYTIGSNASDKKIYVDGVKQTILNGSAFGSSLSRPVEFRNIRIGAYTSSSEGYAMDNFRFYNKVLSDAEVLTIYNAEL